MTFDPTDPNRRTTTESSVAGDRLVTDNERLTTDNERMRAVPSSPRNTGVIGAIVGVLAVVAVVFFVWRGVDQPSTTDTNAGATANQGALNSTKSPAPATPSAPAIPPSGGTQQ